MAIDFTLNGAPRTTEAAPAKPLLWVLREDLAMPGTKFGCGAALCGACTVHIDGVAVRSCVTPVAAVRGKTVTTIEGVAQSDTGKAVAEAWIDLDVPQCGYCQAGQIMTAVALLESNPAPSDAEIDSAMKGNLCRCSSYGRIRSAVRAAADSRA
ncbi:MAG TPA: (2Fe-2S)-binding protein [Croceibacterium sp.]|nr:(2Fe-2S)-binding protein [Croceibacterium sp.]